MSRTCQVVPRENELPCSEQGYDEHPRLCSTHRTEYRHLTAGYKATSLQAVDQYMRVRDQDRDDSALSNLTDVEEAVASARLCIDTLNREIRERQEHHRRFFVERDSGHEDWIKGLRTKLVEVNRIATRLRNRKIVLANDQNSKRRAEEKRLAQKLRDQEAALNSWFDSTWSTKSQPISSSAHECGCSVKRGPDYARPQRTRRVCVSYLDSPLDLAPSSRCTEEALDYSQQCNQHHQDLQEATLALSRTWSRCNDMQTTIRLIQWNVTCRRRFYMFDEVVRDTSVLSGYIALVDEITQLQAKIDRLEGDDPTSYNLKTSRTHLRFSRSEVSELLTALQAIRREALVRSEEATCDRNAEAAPDLAPAATQPPPQEGGHWAAAILGAAVVGVAAFFGFRGAMGRSSRSRH